MDLHSIKDAWQLIELAAVLAVSVGLPVVVLLLGLKSLAARNRGGDKKHCWIL